MLRVASTKSEVKSLPLTRMITRRLNLILTQVYKPSRWNYRLCSTVPQSTEERDCGPLFFDQHVQELLITLTRIDYTTIFAARKDGTSLEVPKFKFMTDKELQAAQSNIALRARRRIQMPPVVKMRSDKINAISNDPAIQGYTNYNYVFTDISFGTTNKNRLIAIREPNGILRHAYPSERHRMNQIYFPIDGREVHIPKMFYDPQLKELLEKEEFLFILDRACLQFEPDDPEYHRVTKEVYTYVNKFEKFDMLRSTRHFGPLCFHLAWMGEIHVLLLDLINSKNIFEAATLIRLYHKLNPTVKSAAEGVQDDIDLIKVYAEMDSSEQYAIIRAIEAYQTAQLEKQEIEMGIKEAHGLTDETDKGLKT